MCSVGSFVPGEVSWFLVFADLNIDFCFVACHLTTVLKPPTTANYWSQNSLPLLWSKIITWALHLNPGTCMGERAEAKEFQLLIVLILLVLIINIYFYTCSLAWLWILFSKEPSFFHHSSPHLLKNYFVVDFFFGFFLHVLALFS